jgi:imidazolonepropionase-like amidohydrolase
MTSETLLLVGGTSIDATGAAARPDTALVAADGHIRTLGARAEGTVDPREVRSRVVDISGRTVMPGLIDSHCHMNYGEVETEEELDLYTSREYRAAIRAVWNAQKVRRAARRAGA